VRIDSRVGRAVLKVSGSATFARFGPSIVTPLDKFVHRVTGGRRTLSKGLLDTVVLTTTGAKSGEPRPVPLACFPDGDVLYIVGSNFGRDQHPAWTANLLKTPQAKASLHGEEFDVRARLLGPDEKTAVWPKLTQAWPNYDVYADRSGRDLRVFALERI
jgi:deazaflavin-dependent oxidoreductase (nitroreductase family)